MGSAGSSWPPASSGRRSTWEGRAAACPSITSSHAASRWRAQPAWRGTWTRATIGPSGRRFPSLLRRDDLEVLDPHRLARVAHDLERARRLVVAQALRSGGAALALARLVQPDLDDQVVVRIRVRVAAVRRLLDAIGGHDHAPRAVREDDLARVPQVDGAATASFDV